MRMTVYIYARVSTLEQHVEQQAEYLGEKYKHDRIIMESFTGKTLKRPEFANLIKTLKKGDTLIVKEVSRLGRKTSEVTTLIDKLKKRGVHLVIDNLGGVDVTSPSGKLIVDVMASIAEMERTNMLERQRIGIERARKEGKFKGRPKAEDGVIKMAKRLVLENGLTKEAAAKQMNIGVATLYRRWESVEV
jgi:DNA invertase Pin-like site-specific DNA recombinase